jgi:predicted kinase
MTVLAFNTHGLSHDDLLSVVPSGPDWTIDWEKIISFIPGIFSAMRECPQDPVYHGEGNVLIHTRMVVEQLVSDTSWQSYATMDDAPDGAEITDPWGLTYKERHAALFWATVLHDIGKVECTVRDEDGRYTSKGHSRIGASMARRFLWHAGSPLAWREAICGIIAAHQVPFWLLERDNAARMAVQLSYDCNTQDLCLHALQDAKGRICNDQEDLVNRVSLAEMFFEEHQSLGSPRFFANDASRVEYFTREDRYVDHVAHEDFPCEVLMMSGLPGAGKDTWLARNQPNLPVVCLDDIRAELNVKPNGNQGAVIQAAKERARQYLRKGESFAWNATCLTRNTRTPLLSLFRDYGARTRIIYIETDPATHRAQNKGRPDAVPDATIDRMIRKLEIPSKSEAHSVTCVNTKDI